MRIRCLKIKVFFIVVMEKHIHKSQLNDHFVFQENDDIIFMIIKTTDHMIHSFKGDRNSFPGDKDTLLSVRSCDTFFDNIKSDNIKQTLFFLITELKYSRPFATSVFFPLGLKASSSLIILKI